MGDEVAVSGVKGEEGYAPDSATRYGLEVANDSNGAGPTCTAC